jgi:hypothetical protein
MTHVHAFTGAESTPGPLVIRTIGVMDLKDALARGMKLLEDVYRELLAEGTRGPR